jgi:glutamate racemase
MTRRNRDEARALAPIGVFDSGVGGLTVAREIVRRMPAEHLLYLADQAHVPYGGRPLDEVKGFAERITQHLFAEGAKAVVMACNISSATALDTLRARFGERRVFGVIQPGARAAIERTGRPTIGVLATAGTVATRAYTRALAALSPEVETIEVACPTFVPLVEAGEFESPAAVEEARRHLAPILSRGADTVILGCTHYPFLLPALTAAAPKIRFIDPARATAAELEHMLREDALAAPTPPKTLSRFFTTGDADAFRAQLAATFPLESHNAARLAWASLRTVPAPAALSGPEGEVRGA